MKKVTILKPFRDIDAYYTAYNPGDVKEFDDKRVAALTDLGLVEVLTEEPILQKVESVGPIAEQDTTEIVAPQKNEFDDKRVAALTDLGLVEVLTEEPILQKVESVGPIAEQDTTEIVAPQKNENELHLSAKSDGRKGRSGKSKAKPNPSVDNAIE